MGSEQRGRAGVREGWGWWRRCGSTRKSQRELQTGGGAGKRERSGGRGPRTQSSAGAVRGLLTYLELGPGPATPRAPQAQRPALSRDLPPHKAAPARSAWGARHGALSCPRHPCAWGDRDARTVSGSLASGVPLSGDCEAQGGWGPPPGNCSAPAGPSWHNGIPWLRAPGRRRDAAHSHRRTGREAGRAARLGVAAHCSGFFDRFQFDYLWGAFWR